MTDSSNQPAAEERIETIVSENAVDALRLRLRRMTSPTICARMLSVKYPSLGQEAVAEKSEGIASSLRSALGYWENASASLNARILNQYYFMLQLSIAEQVATDAQDSTLTTIQRHTENGHGLATLRSPDAAFPDNYYIFALKSGHFGSFCRSLGIDTNAFAFGERRREWAKVTDDDMKKFLTLTELLRRVPGLRSTIYRSLSAPALSFHIAHSSKNMSIQAERATAKMQATRRFVAPNWGPDPSEGPTAETYVTFATGFGGGEGVTAEYLNGLGLPIKDVKEEYDEISGRNDLIGMYTHSSNEYWYKNLPLYHGVNGTSLITPFWKISDVFLLHFVILYTLSIIVRYLPSIWYEIERGKLDHIKVLLDEYIVVTDRVIPELAIERISGISLRVLQPGSLMGPA